MIIAVFLLLAVAGGCVGRLTYDHARTPIQRRNAVIGIIGSGFISFIGIAIGPMNIVVAFFLAAGLTGLGALSPRIAQGAWTGANQGAHDLAHRAMRSRRFWTVVGILVAILVLAKHQEFLPTILTIGVLYFALRWLWGRLRRL